MGDSGRRRWSEGAGVVSDTYLVRRFFNGTLSSAVFGRNKRVRNLFFVQNTTCVFAEVWSRRHVACKGRTSGEGVGCRSAAGAVLGGCGLCAVLNAS